MNPLLKSALGIALGAAAGFLLYRFVGCKTGTCPITANPWTSMLFGAVLGLLLTTGK